jgi:hypothetical protein
MPTRTRGAEPVRLKITEGKTGDHRRAASYLQAIGGEPLAMSDEAVHAAVEAMLKTCEVLERTILPDSSFAGKKTRFRRKVRATKLRKNRWRAYEQVLLELAGRAAHRYRNGPDLIRRRYVVIRTGSNRFVAFSLWRKNAIYVTRTLSGLCLPKRQAREQGAIRICRSGDWRETVLRYF